MAATSQAHLFCFSATVHRSLHLKSHSLPCLSFRPSKVLFNLLRFYFIQFYSSTTLKPSNIIDLMQCFKILIIASIILNRKLLLSLSTNFVDFSIEDGCFLFCISFCWLIDLDDYVFLSNPFYLVAL